MRDRIFIPQSYRDEMLDGWQSKNTLGLKVLENKDIFLLAVALGLSTPEDFKEKKDDYFLLKNVETYDKALFGSILLGKLENTDNIDSFSNMDINYDESERCAISGFKKLKEFIDSAGGDSELLEKRALAQLNLLYQKNVASNI